MCRNAGQCCHCPRLNEWPQIQLESIGAERNRNERRGSRVFQTLSEVATPAVAGELLRAAVAINGQRSNINLGLDLEARSAQVRDSCPLAENQGRQA